MRKMGPPGISLDDGSMSEIALFSTVHGEYCHNSPHGTGLAFAIVGDKSWLQQLTCSHNSIQSSVPGEPELLSIYRQVDLFHFLNFRDDNRMRPCPLKYGPASPHVFADERHQFLPLIRVRHFVGEGEIQVAILCQDNERRTTPHAFPHAFEA